MRSIKPFSVLLGIVLLTGTAFAQQAKRDEGLDLYRAGNFAEAASRLTEATTADKNDYQAWLFLAAAHKHLGKDKEATKAFERSLKIKNHNAPKYDQPAKITSKRTGGIKGDDSSPPSDYAVAVEFRSDSTIGIIIPYLKFFPRTQTNHHRRHKQNKLHPRHPKRKARNRHIRLRIFVYELLNGIGSVSDRVYFHMVKISPKTNFCGPSCNKSLFDSV